MEQEELQKELVSYILKQFDSLAHLKRILDEINYDFSSTEEPDDYKILLVTSYYTYRQDYLKVKGLSMNEEEKALWRLFNYLSPNQVIFSAD